ncbi:Ras family protein [Ancylostoma ceylanicum]|uniref:Ras family protein n=1 Tax=Ancylostoma ceylanicum TaxID=53326 RepID=A0A0D6LL33_9BILA|nr:Ras family protein [Ancylostoma ceylanicum]
MSYASESEDTSNATITTLKILIIGESGVGKSRWVFLPIAFFIFLQFIARLPLLCIIFSLMLRFVDDTFDPELAATIVYDVTNRSSFENLDHWMTEVETYITKGDAVKMLVGNKIDMPNREVSREDGLKFAKRHRALFIEASAKTKEGVQCAFEELIEKVIFYIPSNTGILPISFYVQIIQTPGLWESDRPAFRLGQNTANANDSYCGC